MSSAAPGPHPPGYERFATRADRAALVGQLIVPKSCVLLVIDVQNDYCNPEGALGSAGFDLSSLDPMVDVIETLIGAAHGAMVPVIYLKNEHSDATDTSAWRRRSKHAMSVCRAGTWGADLYRLVPSPDDTVIAKHRYSGFIDSPLGDVLAEWDRTTLVFAGTATNVCVESTARHAAMLDFDVVVVEDGVAATDPDAHRAALENLERFFGHVVPSGVIEAAWNATDSPNGTDPT
jgi:ureidoacrylate peracid hydrolase